MTPDFSALNLQYLIQARDMAKQDPERVAVWLGISRDLAQSLAELTPQQLAQIPQITLPLVVLRQEAIWWQRLFKALQSGHPDEIQVVMAHLNLLAAPASGKGRYN